jgi:hypothetical protein
MHSALRVYIKRRASKPAKECKLALPLQPRVVIHKTDFDKDDEDFRTLIQPDEQRWFAEKSKKHT